MMLTGWRGVAEGSMITEGTVLRPGILFQQYFWETLDFRGVRTVLYSHIAGGAARLRVLIRDDPWNLIRVVPA